MKKHQLLGKTIFLTKSVARIQFRKYGTLVPFFFIYFIKDRMSRFKLVEPSVLSYLVLKLFFTGEMLLAQIQALKLTLSFLAFNLLFSNPN